MQKNEMVDIIIIFYNINLIIFFIFYVSKISQINACLMPKLELKILNKSTDIFFFKMSRFGTF